MDKFLLRQNRNKSYEKPDRPGPTITSRLYRSVIGDSMANMGRHNQFLSPAIKSLGRDRRQAGSARTITMINAHGTQAKRLGLPIAGSETLARQDIEAGLCGLCPIRHFVTGRTL